MAKLTFRLPTGQLTSFNEPDYDVIITAHGYAQFLTPLGSRMEVILAFPQLVNAIEEERKPWWREQ